MTLFTLIYYALASQKFMQIHRNGDGFSAALEIVNRYVIGTGTLMATKILLMMERGEVPNAFGQTKETRGWARGYLGNPNRFA